MKEPPSEVLWVCMIGKTGIPVGSGTITRIKDIVDKYPEWFPWEHKYKTIPQSVHDAFHADAYPETTNIISFDDKGKGLYSMMKDIPVVSISTVEASKIDLVQWFKTEFEKDHIAKEQKLKAERIEKNRVRNIWKKYYDVYGLRFNPNNYLV